MDTPMYNRRSGLLSASLPRCFGFRVWSFSFWFVHAARAEASRPVDEYDYRLPIEPEGRFLWPCGRNRMALGE